MKEPKSPLQTVREKNYNKNVSCKNRRGEWVPAVPLPYYLSFGFRRCECGELFFKTKRYEGHYALEHILGL